MSEPAQLSAKELLIQKRFAIIDVETTGHQSDAHKITDIAIIISDGQQILEQFQSLINPCRSIPAEITMLTGISNEMVANAPQFYQLAKQILELTQNCIFIAHNVNFDYWFIKKEFKELGYDFRRKTACTVRLSRGLFPGFASYSLERLCNDLGISVFDRHRAMGDAKATAILFHKLYQQANNEQDPKYLLDFLKDSNLPSQISRADIAALPEKPGVYFFYDYQNTVIYVGKSINIRKRVLSHFTLDLKNAKGVEFKNKISGIRYELTGTEMIALLSEAEWIKKLKPSYNKALKRSSYPYGLYWAESAEGYIKFWVQETKTTLSPALLTFSSKISGQDFLDFMILEFGLCRQYCASKKESGACFSYHLNECQGACVGKENAEKYNIKAAQIIKRYTFPFDTLWHTDLGRKDDEISFVMIEKGVYKGFGFAHHSLSQSEMQEKLVVCNDNPDVRKILRTYLPY